MSRPNGLTLLRIIPMSRPNGLVVTALLTALVALGPMSTDLYLPSLPGLLRHFDADIAEVQLTLSVFLVGLAVGQLVYGPLSDRFGRRPVLLAGLLLYVVASVICALAPSVPTLIAARLLQATGACAGPVVCRAVVRDVHGREGAARILSYMGAAMALAPALGPILGGFVEAWLGWRANFAILCIYGAVGLALTAAILPETAPHRGESGGGLDAALRGYLGLLGQRVYIGFVLCCALAYGGIFSFISGSSFVFVDIIGLAPQLYGVCFGAIVLGYILGTLVGGRLTRRIGVERLVRTGGLISAVGGLALLLSVWTTGASVPGILLPRHPFAHRHLHDRDGTGTAQRHGRRHRSLPAHRGHGRGLAGIRPDGLGGGGRCCHRSSGQRHRDPHGGGHRIGRSVAAADLLAAYFRCFARIRSFSMMF